MKNKIMTYIIIIIIIIMMIVRETKGGIVALQGFHKDKTIVTGVEGCVKTTRGYYKRTECFGNRVEVTEYYNNIYVNCTSKSVRRKLEYELMESTLCVDNPKLLLRTYTDKECTKYVSTMIIRGGEGCYPYENASIDYKWEEGNVVVREFGGTYKCEGTASKTLSYTLNKCKSVESVFGINGVFSQMAVTSSSAARTTSLKKSMTTAIMFCILSFMIIL
mmetsp:Transcript_1205/g.1836  ORF Transcript_1205/g.1836 Transcript_1205/m.1836 type:complete len:219 (+) Transcript_1205:60-716(+)